jgi:hypothetical protein
LFKLNSSTNKGKGQKEILEQSRDYKEDCGEEEELLNFEGGLQLLIQLEDGDGDGDGDGDEDEDENEDKVLVIVCKNAQRAKHKIVDKYSKTHTINVTARTECYSEKGAL